MLKLVKDTSAVCSTVLIFTLALATLLGYEWNYFRYNVWGTGVPPSPSIAVQAGQDRILGDIGGLWVVDKAANHIAFCRYSVMNHEGGIYCTSQELFLTMLPDRPSVQFGQH